MTEAVIVATARTPIGRAFKGSLKDMRPDDLAALAIKGVLARVPQLDPADIEDVILGCGQPAGEAGFNIARAASILAGLPDIPGVTVNRYCSSSLMTIRMAAHAIKAGEGDVFVAAGVEAISRFGNGSSDRWPNTQNPAFAAAGERTEARKAGDQGDWSAPEGLPDVYIDMGQTAENVVELHNVSRERQDAFAARSQALAQQSIESGFFDKQIIPVTAPDGTVVTKDDSPRAGTTAEKLAGLKPVFRPNGSVTAGNACPLNDGAAAVVVMSDTKAKELGLKPLARIVSSGVSGINPEIMGMGPVKASQAALKRAGLTIDDIDIVEINEAFACQVIASADELGIPLEKLNPNGGSLALGHPFGMTGARIMGTLIAGLEQSGGKYGLETMCVGGGQGMAMIIEKL